MRDDLAERARELAFLFTSWPSVSSSADEAAFPVRLVDRLKHFDKAWVAAIPADPFGRSNVFALKRGRSPRTIVLTGHFDTVTFEDYGTLAELALQTEMLRPALIKELTSSREHPLALSDLESGEFLPGRGLLDMKAGLAAGLAAMEHYSGEATLLFIAVADEEERSAGARAAIPELKAFARDEGLQIVLAINMDSISDQGDGATGRVVAYGSIGKQLVCAHVEGKPVHAGYAQEGVNAAYVMAELLCEYELAPELAEATGIEVAAAPTALFAKDSKQGYNVTSPGAAFAYWNTLQHRRSGEEVMAIAMALAARAVERAEKRTKHKIALLRASDLPRNSLHIDETQSLPDQSRLAFADLVKARTQTGPAVVIGMGSVPYPAVLLKNQNLRRLIGQAVSLYGLGEVNYFAGISDMSFFGETAGDLATEAANTPIWNRGFRMPEPGNFPTINIGPWGRDYHTKYERLHAPYAFDVLPRVLLSVIDAVAKAG